MQNLRLAIPAGVAITVVLLLAACSGSPASSGGSANALATSSSTPAPPVDKAGYIGRQIDPVGTTWTGTDSGGDLSSFTLRADHTVAVSYGTESFSYAGDTWAVSDGVLTLHVFIDHSDGTLDYTGDYDQAAGTIAAKATTSITGKTITVTLSEK